MTDATDQQLGPDPGPDRVTASVTAGDDRWGPTSSTDGSGVRRWPVRRAGNDAERLLCGACGLDLDTGDARLTVAPAPTEDRGSRLVFDGDVRIPVTLLDQGLASQIVELDEPLLSAGVRLELLETVAGTGSVEVALTRFALLGHPAHGEDVALAEQRTGRLPAAGSTTLPA